MPGRVIRIHVCKNVTGLLWKKIVGGFSHDGKTWWRLDSISKWLKTLWSTWKRSNFTRERADWIKVFCRSSCGSKSFLAIMKIDYGRYYEVPQKVCERYIFMWCICFWNAPKSNNFIFCFKTDHVPFFEMPHFFMFVFWNAPFFLSDSENGKNGAFQKKHVISF